MLKKGNLPWPGKTLANQIKKGQVLFTCPIQRKPVWELCRKSLYINSLIEDYPVPPLYFERTDEGKYEVLEGQQRSLTIKEYMEDKFALAKDTLDVTDEEGYPYEIAGKLFSDLPEWAQDNIKNFMFTIYYFEDLTDEKRIEIFRRLNNGKPLTSTELTRVNAKSLIKFQDISHHEMISTAITEAGKQRYIDENVAMQLWTLCFTDMRDLETKGFRPFIQKAIVTDEQVHEIKKALDHLLAVCVLLDPDIKADKRILKKIRTRSHLVSCTYVAMKALRLGVSVEELKEILYKFFDSSKTSVSEIYNKSVRSGSAKQDKVQSRVQVLDSLIGG